MSKFTAATDNNQNHSMLAIQGVAGTSDTQGTSETIPVSADPKTGALYTYNLGDGGTSTPTVLSMEVDSTTSANIVYLGQTDPAYGSAQYGSAVWQITKIDSTTANVVKMSYANSGSFNQVWNSRGTLNYTF